MAQVAREEVKIGHDLDDDKDSAQGSWTLCFTESDGMTL